MAVKKTFHDYCPSALEVRFANEMATSGWYDKTAEFCAEGLGMGCCYKPTAKWGNLYCFAQNKIEFYTVDFFFNVKNRDFLPVVVELDGHDWHERTKEQARRDRARDRELLRSGIVVVRYTGSEVYGNARRCLEETLEIIDALWTRAEAVKAP